MRSITTLSALATTVDRAQMAGVPDPVPAPPLVAEEDAVA